MAKRILIILSILVIGCSQNRGINIYVAKDGNDSWSGTLAQPNAENTDGPLATLETAREKLIQLKKGDDAEKAVTIHIREGIYSLDKTLTFTKEMSGTEQAPVVWQAYEGKKVSFIGGKTIGRFGPVTDKTILNRLPENARKNILQADLKKQGITDFGTIKASGMHAPIEPAGLELFFNGKAMTIARYPNDGWMYIKSVPQFGKTLYHKGVSHTPKDGIPRGRHYGRFTYDGNRPERWKNADEIWMHGYYTWDWADAHLKIKKIDTRKKEIYPEDPEYHYGFTKEQHFYVYNLLEELDAPGEWYLDRTTGILYFWPPEDISSGEAFVSLLEDDMIVFDNASYTQLDGIILEGSRGTAVRMKGGTHNSVNGCTIRNIGNTAAVIEGGTFNGVRSCDIYDTGDGGIYITGGDRMTLARGNNFAVNNHLHDFSRIDYTYRLAVKLVGVGNLAAHNRIHDAPHEALSFQGNDNIVEYNNVYDIVQETGDAGALHTGRDYTWRGNIVRYNYFHELSGPGLFGVMGVYFDDFLSGNTIFGNIFYKAGRATFIGGGRDNVIENNIFVDNEASVHIDARGTTWAKYYFTGEYNVLTERMAAVHYDKPPYSERYPELLKLYDDGPNVPKYNKVLRNISYGGKWLDIEDGVDASLMMMENNLISNDTLCYWRGPDVKDALTGTIYLRGNAEFEKKLAGNKLISGDPGFVNYSNKVFRLKKDSPAWELGFQAIPVEKIGLITDKYRKTIPEGGK